MRVATFNILHGRTAGGGVDLDRMRESVLRLDADVLALQEVDVDQERSGRADLTAVAAEAMGAVAHRFVAAIAGTPGATWMAATGEELPGTAGYGIALLSRYPVVSWQVLPLPRLPFRFPMYSPGSGRVMVVDEEPRTAVVALLETPWGQITFANTHLSFVPGWNRRQLRRLVDDLQGFPGPRMLAGDLNLTPSAVRRSSRMRSLGQAATFPAGSPRRQIDHILTDDARLEVRRCEAPLLPISDHRPLVVDIVKA
ncbi:endonuclease/exonuclease/phosphatase family protein [Mycolicibacterium stellerae]|uniref:endonuclease/exonuclease/phosphatase family protein n=1 Tax=Mycolicibacterium stellerae TaxID=2358193 RepID=UPI000F0B67B0|nr:endonuclease/exonuclease/phosphatase family protein [Mycolicibacterium stellerae]